MQNVTKETELLLLFALPGPTEDFYSICFYLFIFSNEWSEYSATWVLPQKVAVMIVIQLLKKWQITAGWNSSELGFKK